MPLEFPCNECRQLVRTPDSAAGKKGKCPHCGAVMTIPGGTPPPPPPPARPEPAKPKYVPPRAPAKPVATNPPITKSSPPPVPPKSDTKSESPIEFYCAQCGELVRTPAAAAGKKGRCPHCQAIVQIPSSTSAPGKISTPPSPRKATTPAPQPTTPKAESPKPQTTQPAASKPAAAKSIAPKPTPPKPTPPKTTPPKPANPPTKTPASERPTGGKSSIGKSDKSLKVAKPLDPPTPPKKNKASRWANESPGLTPLGDSALGGDSLSGLTPLESSGLTPLSPLPDSQPTGLVPLVPLMPLDGLTPLTPQSPDLPGLDPLSGLTPLDQGLTPLASNPFAPAGQAYAPTNPYASPSAYSQPGRLRRPGEVSSLVTTLPAVFMMLSTLPTIIYILIQGASTLIMVLGVATRAGNRPEQAGVMIGASVVSLLVLLVWFCLVLLIIKGSIDLMNRQSYGWAMTASIFSLLLCTCGIGFPFGLWSLIVLCLPDVRREFRG